MIFQVAYSGFFCSVFLALADVKEQGGCVVRNHVKKRKPFGGAR